MEGVNVTVKGNMRCRIRGSPCSGGTWALRCPLRCWRMQRRFRYAFHPGITRGMVSIRSAGCIIEVWAWLLFRGSSNYLSGRCGICLASFALISAILYRRERADETPKHENAREDMSSVHTYETRANDSWRRRTGLGLRVGRGRDGVNIVSS
jgi:hypothetical protein